MKISRTPTETRFPGEFKFYRNGQLQAEINERLTYRRQHRRQINQVDARNNNKAGACGTSAEKEN